MQNVDRLFMLTGIVLGALGMTLGLKMGMTQDFSQIPTHVHTLLLGWVFMALFALAYHAWPAMKASGLARVHYILHTISILGIVVLLYIMRAEMAAPEVVGPFLDTFSVGTLIGLLIFGYNFLKRAN